MEDKIKELEDKLYQKEKQLHNVHTAYKDIEYELKQYKEIISAHNNKQLSNKTKNNYGDYWAWQPDEENHIESLICPVLIPAEWLRNLLEEAYMNGMMDAYKSKQKFHWLT